MSSALLRVERLHLSAGQGAIVNNLTFQIGPGEIVALTGKSGSGKTSIALSILGLLPSGIHFKEGSICWCPLGQEELILPADINSWNKLRGRHIGFTQQDVFGAFDPVMRMGIQMLMVINERAVSHQPGIERELRMKMEEVGLHDIDRILNSFPHQLSGGQLQRCQIAMAIVIRPELLIADEPTSAIDKINQIELLDVFSMLRTKYNMAILCITHEEAVVRHLADREVQLDSIESDFPLPDSSSVEIPTHQEDKVLDVKGLEYTHAYGGMMHRKGATVGPLDFALYRGRCMGIVGESGSGKSTLAQLLVGLYTPLHGQVILDNNPIEFRNFKDVGRLRAKVQLVMQDGRGALHPYMTMRNLLDEVSQIRKKSDPAFAYELSEVLGVVGLPESVLDRAADQLSGGECLRISIARALLLKPEILICDESTSALDGETRDGIISLLVHLKKVSGMALIFISHDERIIRGIADEIMVLAEGKVVEKGEAGAVIKYPTHPVTKKIFTLHATLEQRGRL